MIERPLQLGLVGCDALAATFGFSLAALSVQDDCSPHPEVHLPVGGSSSPNPALPTPLGHPLTLGRGEFHLGLEPQVAEGGFDLVPRLLRADG
jgi:hypothetical protein